MSDYSNLIVADSPIFYYRCNSTTGSVLVDEIAGRNATLTGSLTPIISAGLLTSDPTNNCVRFTGSSARAYYTLANQILNGATALTLETWVKRYQDPGPNVTLFHITDAVNYPRIYFRINSADKLEAYLQMAASTFVTITSTETLATLGVPYHVAVTFDLTNDTCSMYLNGVQIKNEVACAFPMASFSYATNAVMVMGNENSTATILYGYLDEIAVYTSKLSAAQILEHYNTGMQLSVEVGNTESIVIDTYAPTYSPHNAVLINTADISIAAFTPIVAIGGPVSIAGSLSPLIGSMTIAVDTTMTITGTLPKFNTLTNSFGVNNIPVVAGTIEDILTGSWELDGSESVTCAGTFDTLRGDVRFAATLNVVGSLPILTGAVVVYSEPQISITGSIPNLNGSSDIYSESNIAIIGTLPALAANISIYEVPELNITGTFTLIGSTSIAVESTSSLLAVLPQLIANTSIATETNSVLNANLPALAGSVGISVEQLMSIVGTAPALIGSVNINNEPGIIITSSLPKLVGSANVHYENNIVVSGTIQLDGSATIITSSKLEMTGELPKLTGGITFVTDTQVAEFINYILRYVR